MKNFKNLFAAVIIAIALSACSGESGDDKGGSGSTASTSNNGYTAEATKVAIEQCMQSGASEEMCQCATKELQKRISADQMKQIEADMAAGKAMSEEFAQASAEAGMKCVQAQN